MRSSEETLPVVPMVEITVRIGNAVHKAEITERQLQSEVGASAIINGAATVTVRRAIEEARARGEL